MIFKKNKAILAAAISAAVLASTMLPCVASAAGTRTKEEAYGDDTYAQRFLSLYDDVITNGQENGYLSSTNVASGGFGIPYHAVETCIVEAPDYGHETTSEAMSYIVWMAAMRDNIVANSDYDDNESTGDLVKAWKTMEEMIPTTQTGFWSKTSLSAQYSPEDTQSVETYPQTSETSNTGANPIHAYFTSAYSSDGGEYLLHWLADVDDWYGYGGRFDNGVSSASATGKFTFINTFQRGNQESCFETIPHPSIETLKYGNSTRGIKGVFSKDAAVTSQWSYTNAPDAEDRAIQAIYAANKWGVGDVSVDGTAISALAGKMGDELRNNMFDKYYKAIGCQSSSSPSTGYDSCHYLMSWYTAWGGANDGQWAWQIGCSHAHEFYQNPLAAYGLLYDDDLSGAMKATNAIQDYKTSLKRQLEFYLWLQSDEGLIAGGATNSWNGRYDTYTSGVSTFYDMAYTVHPVYADPGSNHWIGNQVWAMQRLAELYYYVKTEGDASEGTITPGGLSIEECLETILDKWVAWFIENTELTDDGDYAIPSTVDWSGQPASWTGEYSATANSGLHCSILTMGKSDLGCVSSLANTLIYYAGAKGTDSTSISATSADAGEQALYLAQQLLDREWNLGRDDIGLSRTETNGSLSRIFNQDVWVPNDYVGTMPNGDTIQNGIKFIDIRSMYLEDDLCVELKEAYDTTGSTESVELNYHRFWHAGDILLALGAMYEVFPELTPTDTEEETLELSATTLDLAVGETDTITSNVAGTTWTSSDESIATVDADGVVTAVAEGTATITATTPLGQTAEVAVTVTDEPVVASLYGDVNVDGDVTVSDIILLARYLAEDTTVEITAQGYANADCEYDGYVTTADLSQISRYLVHLITLDELGPQD